MKKLTKKQLDILFNCWKDADTTKDRIELIEERLPKVSSLAALSVMRSMAKTDTKWLRAATRKKNKKEKERLEKKKEREKKKAEKEKRRKEREKKREKRERKEKEKNKLDKIRNFFTGDDLKTLEEKVDLEFVFCNALHYYVNNIACIYRAFSKDGFILCSQCENCSKMGKYLSIVEEIADARKKVRKKTRRHKTSRKGNKVKKQAGPKKRKGKARSNN